MSGLPGAGSALMISVPILTVNLQQILSAWNGPATRPLACCSFMQVGAESASVLWKILTQTLDASTHRTFGEPTDLGSTLASAPVSHQSSGCFGVGHPPRTIRKVDGTMDDRSRWRAFDTRLRCTLCPSSCQTHFTSHRDRRLSSN